MLIRTNRDAITVLIGNRVVFVRDGASLTKVLPGRGPIGVTALSGVELVPTSETPGIGCFPSASPGIPTRSGDRGFFVGRDQPGCRSAKKSRTTQAPRLPVGSGGRHDPSTSQISVRCGRSAAIAAPTALDSRLRRSGLTRESAKPPPGRDCPFDRPTVVGEFPESTVRAWLTRAARSPYRFLASG